MKFLEISGDFVKFPPENEKVDLAVDRLPFLVVILPKMQFFMIFMKFHNFHENTLFAPKWESSVEGSDRGRLTREKRHYAPFFALYQMRLSA